MASMQQIRFDFLGGVNGNSRNSSANANTAETGDAFAQILDQQLTRRADAGTDRRTAEPRERSDASERTDGRRPQVLKRRDAKTSTAANTKPETTTAKPAAKAKHAEKTATESETCGKPATKPAETDEMTEAAAVGQTAAESESSGTTTKTEGNSDTSGDTDQQQQNDEQQAGDDTDQSETAAASADLSLLAMLAVPLPLQTLTADADASVDATDATGGNAAAALQAQLAASLAGSIDLSAAVNGKAQVQNTGGLKFGAMLNADIMDPQKAGTDIATALEDAADQLTKTADSLPQLAPDANGKVRDPASTAAGPKAREAAQDKAAAIVTPELNAKTAASIVQPMARTSAVTWSGTTNIRNELAESMSVQAGTSFATDDAEFSNWSQVLGSGAGGLGSSLSARQTAFMTQLRQNLQNLPAHEQIAVQIKNAMQNGNSRLTVALHPVELGRVEVKLDIDKDKNVTATIVVDRPATLDMLRNDAKALERALQDAGLQTGSGSLSFNLRDSNGQNGSPAQNGTGTGGSGTGAGGSEAKAEVRSDVVATADGYVDLET
jgi:flagellar hook-length control protein FliK